MVANPKHKKPVKSRPSSAKSKGNKSVPKRPAQKKPNSRETNIFRMAIENSFDIIGIIDSGGKIEFISPSIKRILGVDPKDLLGKNFIQFIHPDDAKAMGSLAAKVLKTPGTFYLGEFRIKKKDGSVRVLEGNGKGIIDQSGKIQIIANAHDITNRLLAEKKLIQTEEMYRSIAEAAHDMIFQIDKNDIVEYVNASGAKQFGKKPEDLIGKPREMLFPTYVSKRQGDSLKKVFISGIPLYFANEIPFPKGRMILDTWLVPLMDESGVVKSVFGISRDVTSAKLAQEELEKRTKEAEESGARAQVYFDFLAHDIANLVSPILSYSETILSREDIPPEIAGFTSKIADQSKQMASFIHLLRMLVEAEKVPPQDADILDLRSILMEMNAALQQVDNKDFRIIFDVPSDGKIEVIGGMHIRNAILLGFARAMKIPLGEKAQIEIRMIPVKMSNGKSYWQIKIQIPGHPVSDEIRDALSNPFTPAKRFRRRSASDVSFAISIIEHFGGRVWAEDMNPGDPSKGHIVIAELPMATDWSSEHST